MNTDIRVGDVWRSNQRNIIYCSKREFEENYDYLEILYLDNKSVMFEKNKRKKTVCDINTFFKRDNLELVKKIDKPMEKKLYDHVPDIRVGDVWRSEDCYWSKEPMDVPDEDDCIEVELANEQFHSPDYEGDEDDDDEVLVYYYQYLDILYVDDKHVLFQKDGGIKTLCDISSFFRRDKIELVKKGDKTTLAENSTYKRFVVKSHDNLSMGMKIGEYTIFGYSFDRVMPVRGTISVVPTTNDGCKYPYAYGIKTKRENE